MSRREDIIDLLLENQATVIRVAEEVTDRLIESPPMFEEEVQEQFIDNIKKSLLAELYNKGLTIEDFSVTISEDELTMFIEKVLKNGRD